ncbi:MAG: right-handed parallel beta-helix repeat-containing protein [Ginsengibacter sp.]
MIIDAYTKIFRFFIQICAVMFFSFLTLFILSLNGYSFSSENLEEEKIVIDKPYKGSGSSIIHITEFGAIGDGISNCTKAFQKAAKYLQLNGGTLIIDSGVYIVGKQKLSSGYWAGSSYFAESILEFKHANKPIIILGQKATLKANDGLKYGSFNPVTGKRDSLRKEGNKSDYYASAYTIINAVGCVSISISGLILDGNSEKLDVGPSFGKEGIQLAATGISLYNNKKVSITDCYIHHCALDAIIVAWAGLKNTDPIYLHTIKNVIAKYNGRQGLSWVGGNDLTVINSEFSSTGKAYNNSLPIVSKPSAGIDIEIENSIIKNGNFIGCKIYDNVGPGLSSIGHDTYNINFKNCIFIGTTSSAAYPKSQNFSFDSCTFVGKVERIFGSADNSKAISFKNCLFTMDESRSPNGKVYGETWEFYEGQNVVFDNCEFDAENRKLPIFNNKEIVFLNCRFSQDGDVDFYGSASFKGTTRFIMKGKGKLNISESEFEGQIIYNNQAAKDIKKIKID